MPTPLPVRDFFLNTPANVAQNTCIDTWDDIITALHENLGSGDEGLYTVSGGTISMGSTPTASIRINNTGTGIVTFSSLDVNNFNDFHYILIRPDTAGDDIRIMHGVGTNNFNLRHGWSGGFHLMNSGQQCIVLQRRGTAWQELWRGGASQIIAVSSFLNSWTTVPTRTVPQFYLDGYNCVIEGVIQNGSSQSSISSMFTIPTGYRPATINHGVKYEEIGSPRGILGYLIDSTTGNFQYVPIGPATYTAGRPVVLSSIRYRVGA